MNKKFKVLERNFIGKKIIKNGFYSQLFVGFIFFPNKLEIININQLNNFFNINSNSII